MKRSFISILVFALGAAGCGGASSPVMPQGISNLQSPANLQEAAQASVLHPFRGPSAYADFAWGKALREKMTFVKPAPQGAMEVDVLVRMRDPKGLADYALSASDPHSASYRRFLTPEQIADRFGATQGDYDEVADYFAKIGMRVGMWPQRETLTVTGTLRQMTRAFGTNFAYFHYGRQVVLAPVQTPHFSRALPIDSVLHLTSYNPARTYYVRGVYAHFAGYPPQMLANGFRYTGAYQAGYTGKGIYTAINGTGPISPADVPAYGRLWRDPVAKVVQVNASPQPASKQNGGTGTGAVDPYPAGLTGAPPATAPCSLPYFPTPPNYNTCNPEDYEAQLDTEQVASLAPGATELFYLAYNPSICVDPKTGDIVPNKKNGACPKGSEDYPLIGIQLADDSLQQTIADNRADSISLSWGEPENDALADDYISANPKKPGVGQVEFASLAAEGVAVFVSSGDDGAWECQDPYTGNWLGIPCVSYPASDPNVTAVGGVNIPLTEGGMLDGQITAWGDNTTGGGNGSFRNDVGSGGGKSAVFPAPPWQAKAVRSTVREVPDIALDADPETGPSQLNYANDAALKIEGDTQVFADGGTSAAAPEANAEWALVLQACSASTSCATAGGAKPYRLGNAAPLYYGLYKTSAYAKTFYDVVYGSNRAIATPKPNPGQTPPPETSGYSAKPGYDMVTGLGVPFGGHLINSVLKETAGGP